MVKNEEIVLEITSMSSSGDGVGHFDGMAVFVPFSAVGDLLKVKILKVKNNYCYGKIIDIIEKSNDRIEIDCAGFKQCGGCNYRHITYNAEAKLKTETVENAIKRIGKIDLKPNEIIKADESFRYRNKAQAPFSLDKQLGFYAQRSHRVIPFANGECLIQPTEFDAVYNAVNNLFENLKISAYNEETHKGILRHLYLRKAFATGEIMAVLVINDTSFGYEKEFLECLQKILGNNLVTVIINYNTKQGNTVLGKQDKVIFGNGYITDILCGVKIRISPHSFYQVNRAMAEKLYNKACEYALPQNKTVLDLYCGAGTIGLSMANKAKKIIGIEIVEQAVNDAKFNAKLNNIKNAEFICADATNGAEILAGQKIKPDVVIVDPPRKGCDKNLLNCIANKFSPERIVYVSCDPATLARDCNIFDDLGYKLIEYTPVDLFPRTCHIETVALLQKTTQL